ncbi:BRI1 kinase inhibitor 1-like [Primulina eburnea]|uniref:BRI1 kinase inhibitor 1-like n=1 Tax=Primulina eburnea TaxID=1245227 RepID=UPI003C6C5ADB
MEIRSQIETNTEEENPNGSKFNPLSPTSSPNHEFSFTTSLHPQSEVPDQNKSNPSFAMDLSPADKIFFHGHLLPLHYLSNHPVYPRCSTDSFDSFTLPIEELSGEYNSSSNTYTDQQEYISIDHINPTCQESCSSVLKEEGRPRKPISFSFFGFSKWRKGCEEKQDNGRQETDRKQKRKSKFNLSTVVKRCTRFINPFLSLRNRRMNPQFHGQTYSSFSGNLRVRNKKELRGRRGEFSAPASMRNCPTNSGLLVASGTATPTARDSTMEELQAAVQSAIAHCKKSIVAEETIHVK